MRAYKWSRAGKVVSLVLVAGCIVWGCSANRPDQAVSAGIDDTDQTEIACEIALLRLEQLIQTRSSQENFPAAILFEANELYRIGMELYLEGEYGLSLELVEEAIKLLEEEHN
jgi:lipoprotein NlpI